MLYPNVTRVLVSLVTIAGASLAASAEDWGAKMLDRTEVKFGTVARYSDTKFPIKVKNVFGEQVQITSLSVSCGCISWIDEIRSPVSLAPGEERDVTIRLNTHTHVGDRHVKAFVALQAPKSGLSSTVTIPVEGNIRSDFEVRPSHVAFGSIDFGKSYTQRIDVNYTGGRYDWALLEAKATNPHFAVKTVEKSRNGGSVNYEVQVTIDATSPLGSMRDQLLLTTNDRFDAKVAIPIEARIDADIVVADAQFGTVASSQPKSVTAIVRGKKPFKIQRIDRVIHAQVAKPAADGTVSSSDQLALGESIALKYAETTGAVQVITLTLNAPSETGKFEEEFVIVIEGRAVPVTLKAKGRIVGQEITGVPAK